MINPIVNDPKHASLFHPYEHEPTLDEQELARVLRAKHRAERRARVHAFLSFVFLCVYPSPKPAQRHA